MGTIRSQVCHPLAVDENLESVHDVLRAISMDVADAFGLKMHLLIHKYGGSLYPETISWGNVSTIGQQMSFLH